MQNQDLLWLAVSELRGADSEMVGSAHPAFVSTVLARLWVFTIQRVCLKMD